MSVAVHTTPAVPFEPPIVYRRARAWATAFPCPVGVVTKLLPLPDLVPITAWPGTGVLAAAVFDYQDSSIGPYRSLVVALLCQRRGGLRLPLLPLLAESWTPDVGVYPVLLAVTTPAAHDSATTVWGYPTIQADIDLRASSEHVGCVVSEGGRPIARFEMYRPGEPDWASVPLRTYSCLGDELCFASTMIDGKVAVGRLGARASLHLDDHPHAEALRRLPRVHDRPLEVRWFDEYRTLFDKPEARFRMGR